MPYYVTNVFRLYRSTKEFHLLAFLIQQYLKFTIKQNVPH